MRAVTAERVAPGKVREAMGCRQERLDDMRFRRPGRLRVSLPSGEELIDNFEGYLDGFEDGEARVLFEENGKAVAYRMPLERLQAVKRWSSKRGQVHFL